MNKKLFFLLSTAVFLLLALGWWNINQRHYSSAKTRTRLQVTTKILPYTEAFQGEIQKRFALLDGLHAFAASSSRENITESFEPFAEELISSEEGLRNLSIAPDGVQEFVYPIEGNEEVPGHDLINDPREEVRKTVEKTIDSKTAVASGPYELRQGGLGLIVRRGVYKKDSFWGLVAIVIDMPPMFEKSGLSRVKGFEMMLSDSKGEVFWGSPEVRESNPITIPFEIADEEWHLSAVPSSGWKERYWNNSAAFFTSTLIIVILVFLGLLYLIQRVLSISAYVKLEEEKYHQHLLMYKAAIDSSQDIIAAVDTDYKYIFGNRTFLQRHQIEEEQVLGTHVRDILDEESFASYGKGNIDSALRGNAVSYDLQRENSSGETEEVNASYYPLRNNKEIVGIVEIIRDISERKEYEKQLLEKQKEFEKAAEEKETLLKEVHHRVKNNLNVVVSLLKLQQDEISSVEDAQEALTQSSNRIYSMALVHESLYRSESLSEVDMEGYIKTMVGQLKSSTTDIEHIEFFMDLDSIQLDITKAIPCGIIINELITNAQKHAFSRDTGGSVTISFKRTIEKSVMLSVSDNGRGLPDGFSPENTGSLGFSLINILTHQIDGVLDYKSKEGASFIITIPAE